MLSSVPLQAGGDAMLISMLIGTLIGLVIAIGAGYWIYKDASKRENNELLWGVGTAALLLLLFPIGLIAVIAYFILRGDETDAGLSGDTAAGGEW